MDQLFLDLRKKDKYMDRLKYIWGGAKRFLYSDPRFAFYVKYLIVNKLRDIKKENAEHGESIGDLINGLIGELKELKEDPENKIKGCDEDLSYLAETCSAIYKECIDLYNNQRDFPGLADKLKESARIMEVVLQFKDKVKSKKTYINMSKLISEGT